MTDIAAITETPPTLDLLDSLIAEVEEVFHGKEEVVRLAVAALLARGHILFEDVPGVGKTTLAHALATALGLSFRRIQFTSDLLPSDVLGVSIFNPRTSQFETHRGPIFTNLVLADEINRAPPRTQSGLLQAMQEGQVSLDEDTFELPQPFMVMATQNPLEHHGTYSLPESQVDRFLMRLTIGYPGEGAERRILLESTNEDPWEQRIKAVLDPPQVLELQREVSRVEADDSLVGYVMAIVQRTRIEPREPLRPSLAGPLLRPFRRSALEPIGRTAAIHRPGPMVRGLGRRKGAAADLRFPAGRGCALRTPPIVGGALGQPTNPTAIR